MIQVFVSDEIRCACPSFAGAAIRAKVVNSSYSPALWKRIGFFSEEYRTRYTVDSLKEMPSIQATRAAYRRCGKDPSRYRPSGEALCRRILRGLPLYQVNTLVDLINLVSIATGYSIGGFDEDRIQGNVLVLGIGRAGEAYEGIGRGVLNIEGMPVYRDAQGGIGTPTSDHERTKLSLETTRLLVLVNGYSGRSGLEEAVRMMQELLREFAAAVEMEVTCF